MSTTINITFTLYNASTGGTALWNETQNVQVSNGLFNVQLGSVQQLSSAIILSDSLYLGIQVGADAEMLPKQRILAGAYIHSVVPVGTINSWAKNIPGMPQLPEGWVECNGQILNDSLSPLNGQIIPDLNGHNRFLRGNSTSGDIGGTANHKHESPVLSSSDSSDNLYKGRYDSSPFGLGSSTNSTDKKISIQDPGGAGTTYNVLTNIPHESGTINPGLPPYYSIVWIIKVR